MIVGPTPDLSTVFTTVPPADGEVLYTLTKPNPRYHPDARYQALDRTKAAAEQKVYVPYKAATVAPQLSRDDRTGMSGSLVTVLFLVTMALGAAACVKTGTYRNFVGKKEREAMSLSETL